MIGGEEATVGRLGPVFSALAPVFTLRPGFLGVKNGRDRETRVFVLRFSWGGPFCEDGSQRH